LQEQSQDYLRSPPPADPLGASTVDENLQEYTRSLLSELDPSFGSIADAQSDTLSARTSVAGVQTSSQQDESVDHSAERLSDQIPQKFRQIKPSKEQVEAVLQCHKRAIETLGANGFRAGWWKEYQGSIIAAREQTAGWEEKGRKVVLAKLDGQCR
jgi:hypothetical protein